MRRSSGRRGQAEPLVALAAVTVVALALATYAGALAAVLPATPDPGPTQSTADRVERAVTDGAVARPDLLSRGRRAAPASYRVNVSLRTAGRTWHRGPPAANEAALASRRVGVRTAPGTVRPGRLEVRLWR